MTAAERFWRKVDITDACWLWTGATVRGTYGKFSVGGRAGRLVPAHRFAYELLVGPVPEGHELHHRCETKRCVRPDHLEPKTRRAHMAEDGRLPSLRTHCPQGHPYDEANTYVSPRDGSRRCRPCHAAGERRRKRAAPQRSLRGPA